MKERQGVPLAATTSAESFGGCGFLRVVGQRPGRIQKHTQRQSSGFCFQNIRTFMEFMLMKKNIIQYRAN